MTNSPKRRWLSFSLRTMFVVVTAGALLVAWILPSVKWVRQRESLLQEFDYRLTGCTTSHDPVDISKLPLTLRLLGAQPVDTIILNPEYATDADLRYFQATFPEATVTRVPVGDQWEDAPSSPPQL